MTHKRNGRAAKLRRQQRAQNDPAAEKLVRTIFGEMIACDECGMLKSPQDDCMSPHCKAARAARSTFYDECTDDHVEINGSRLEAGIDY